jgi:hypothetical protein
LPVWTEHHVVRIACCNIWQTGFHAVPFFAYKVATL